MTLFDSRQRARQLIDFSGMVLGENAYPTDIDGFIEWRGKGYVIIEMKYHNAIMKYGQELALTRLADDLRKPTLLVIASHETPLKKDVDMAESIVTKYRYEGRWHYPDNLTVRKLVDGFLSRL